MGASTPPFGDLSGAGDESAASAAAFRRAKSMSAARVWVGLLRGLGLRRGMSGEAVFSRPLRGLEVGPFIWPDGPR